jgi:hypothetical protein
MGQRAVGEQAMVAGVTPPQVPAELSAHRLQSGRRFGSERQLLADGLVAAWESGEPD